MMFSQEFEITYLLMVLMGINEWPTLDELEEE